MAFLTVNNSEIRGIAACVPKKTEENSNLSVFDSFDESAKFIVATGVERRRVAGDNICTSDLCFAAAEKLIDELGWERDSIDCLIFVSQTPDYIFPATSCILQHRLGLSEECYTLDISSGCSGWVYGMSVITNLISSGAIQRGLFMAGDTATKTTSEQDKSTFPLFGDAGTATAIEYNLQSADINFHLASDGNGYQAIMIPYGGSRNRVDPNSFEMETFEKGVSRNKTHVILNGMDVFAFGISKAPESVRKLFERFTIDSASVDYLLFHQANMFMNEKIRKKLKLSEEQVPYSLHNFGNTSSASIPLTMVTELRDRLTVEKLNMVGCGFGVGLSWGSVSFSTDRICVPELIEI